MNQRSLMAWLGYSTICRDYLQMFNHLRCESDVDQVLVLQVGRNVWVHYTKLLV